MNLFVPSESNNEIMRIKALGILINILSQNLAELDFTNAAKLIVHMENEL